MNAAFRALSLVALVVLAGCGATPSQVVLPYVNNGPYIDVPGNAAKAAEAAAKAAEAALLAAGAATKAASAPETSEGRRRAHQAAAEAAKASQLAAIASKQAAEAATRTTPGIGRANPSEQRYRTGPEADAKALAAAGAGDLPREIFYDGVLAQLDAHYRVWNKQADEIQLWVDNTNNWTFAGALIGGAGVLAKSLDTGRVGAALAGGASLWGNHFAWSTQAANYRLARDAVFCMHAAVLDVPASIWKQTFDDEGRPREGEGFYLALANDDASRKAAADGYAALSSMFRKLHDGVRAIRERLASKQRTSVVAAPKPDEIAAALRAQGAAEQGAKDFAKAAAETRAEVSGVDTSAEGATVPVELAERRVIDSKMQQLRQQLTLQPQAQVKLADLAVTATELKNAQRSIAQERSLQVARAMGETQAAAIAKVRALDLPRLEQLFKLPATTDKCVSTIGP